jgi:hypothetical protein
MTGGEFEHVCVLHVGDKVVPFLFRASSGISPGNEAGVAAQFENRLENESAILHIAVGWRTLIHQEHGNCASAFGKPRQAAARFARARVDFQTPGVRNDHAPRGFADHGDRNAHRLTVWSARPNLIPWNGRRAVFRSRLRRWRG